MLRLIYLTLEKHLTDRVSAINEIDWHLGQLAQEDPTRVVETAPVLYLKFMPIQWQTLGGNIQRGVLYFEAHLATETGYGDSRDMTDTEHIDHLRIEAEVFRALMNQRFLLSDAPGMAALRDTPADRVLVESIVRVATEPHDGRFGPLAVSVQRFAATVFDYSATREWREILAALAVEVEIDKNLADG